MDVPTSTPCVFAVAAHRLTCATTAMTLSIAPLVSRESSPLMYTRRKSLTFSSPFGVSVAARMSASVANRSPSGRSRLRIRFASGRNAPHSLARNVSRVFPRTVGFACLSPRVHAEMTR